ncbi:unnamed protein product [Protopolystoma xenopodis]|uniref:dihydrofolate reductase n=1 Tax=Protopolystoma xenopodis TaxID=117903 RepID=A0A3S5A492_9PLAT|nr:unnamed protein product [Protopolystoma xenopodis]
MTLPRINVIVSVSNNGGIGLNGKLPWHLKGDMEFFLNTTKKAVPDKMNAVVMGKKTWFSIPAKFRPLPGRINMILSSSPFESNENCMWFKKYDECVSVIEDLFEKGRVDQVFIIGGAQVYSEALNQKKYPVRIYCTHVLSDVEHDVKFPFDSWDSLVPVFLPEVPTDIIQEGNLKYRFAVYDFA